MHFLEEINVYVCKPFYVLIGKEIFDFVKIKCCAFKVFIK